MNLTIILTVYNKAPYLKRVFEALLTQEDTRDGEFEVLAVNDGSTDDSAAILEEYAKKDARVRVMTQENQGLSMARNNGTEIARGEYVWHVDADDSVSPDAVRKICDAMATKPDIIAIYARTEGIDKVRNQIPPSAKDGKDIILSHNFQPNAAFNILRRSFVEENGLSFFPGIYHEDSEFTPRMLYAAKSVVVVPEVLYTFFRVPNSITQVPRVKRAFDNLIVAESLNRFVEENGEVGTTIGQVLDNKISVLINNAFNVIVQNDSVEQRRFCELFKSKPHMLRPLRNASKIKYRIEAFLFKMFPSNTIGIYKIMINFG